MSIYGTFRARSSITSWTPKKIALTTISQNTSRVDLSNQSYVPAISNGAWAGGVNRAWYGTGINYQEFIFDGGFTEGESINQYSEGTNNIVRIYAYTDQELSSYSTVALVETLTVEGVLTGTAFNGLSPGGVVPAASSGKNDWLVAVNDGAVDEGGNTVNISQIGTSNVGYRHLYKITTSENGSWYVVSDSSDSISVINSGYPDNNGVEYLGTGLLFVYGASSVNILYNEGGRVNVDNPYDEGGNTGGADGTTSTGGGGYFGKNPTTGQPETSDLITVPNGSVAGDASATGMMTRYLANSSQLEIFGDWLWTDDLGLAIAKAGISLLYGSPAEAVISLMSYPFDISSLSGVTTRSQNLYWGNHNSGIGATALISPAATIDWGTISLNEYWGNFLDYEPHTKIELYLPWGTGFVSVDPGQCLPGTLRVVTNIDLNKGSCIHNVFGNNGCVIGTYAGQCSQQIPIISNDYASKIAGVVTAGVSLAIGGVSGIGAGKSAENARLDYDMNVPLPAMNNIRAMQNYYMGMEEYASAVSKSTNRGRTASNLASIGSVAAARHSGIIARNGSFTDGSAALGCQYPYIILSRPSQSVPKEYGSHYGYPSNIYTQLSNLKGYTEVGEIHLNGINATEPEITELDKILKGGVIF